MHRPRSRDIGSDARSSAIGCLDFGPGVCPADRPGGGQAAPPSCHQVARSASALPAASCRVLTCSLERIAER